MVVRHIAIFFAFFAALLFSDVLPAMADAARPTGAEIMDKMYTRPEGKDRTGIMTMTLTNGEGAKKVLTFKYYIKEYGRDKKSLITFSEPEQLQGMGLLQYDNWDPSVEDERWLFLPEKKDGTAAPAMNKGFLGSDFTYEEMGWRSTDEDNHKLVGEEVISGVPCWIVESTPKDENHAYSKVVTWVNKDNSVYMKSLFYDREGKLLKKMTTSDILKKDGYWTVYKTRMENVQKSHVTEYSLQDIQHDTGLSDDLFDPGKVKGHLIKIDKTKK